MCLILIAYRCCPGYPLVLAANRDEFHRRPTAPAHWWDEPPILAGRDLQAGGTWLAMDRRARLAAITNFRDPPPPGGGECSRGELPVAFLESSDEAAFAGRLEQDAGRYDGYNLITLGVSGLRFHSNRVAPRPRVEPGIHGMSNGDLDAPWPKVRRGRALLEAALHGGAPAPDDLLALLADRHQPADEALPDTGVPLPWERILAPMFIVSEGYGTRSSTAVTVADDGGVTFVERRFDSDGNPQGEVREQFQAPALREGLPKP